jgi:exodeoxyribonuclease-1
MNQTILWYDIETFGTNPAWDKVAQFAAVRTDSNFDPIEDPLVLYCKITPDYIPDPMASLITGITPQETLEKGISEYEFIKAINQQFLRPGTCVAGYNSIRFDDEFIRNLYYRNFFDPYVREWSGGNSRWDIIDLVRMTHDLRPEGINWPVNEEGRPVFNLEELTQANGLSHKNAHDALSDVFATIDLARLIHEKQPKLFKYYFKLRKKNEAASLIDLHNPKPLIHTSSMFTNGKGCTGIVLPLTVDPNNRNCILSYDLSEDPGPLLELSVEDIQKRIFTRHDQMPEGIKRIPVKGIHLNKCPAIAPLNTLTEENAIRLGLDIEESMKNYEKLKKGDQLIQKLHKVFDSKILSEKSDPDFQIYSGGFFHDDDKKAFRKIHERKGKDIFQGDLKFEDPRVPEMLRRFQGRNFPETMTEEEKKRWVSFCAGRILMPPTDGATSDFGEFNKRLETYKKSHQLSAGDKMIIKSLMEYSAYLKKEILEYSG